MQQILTTMGTTLLLIRKILSMSSCVMISQTAMLCAATFSVLRNVGALWYEDAWREVCREKLLDCAEKKF